MPLTEQEVKRLNISMPVANDVKLGDLLKSFEESTGGEISVAWGDVTGKPSSFPPATHTHSISQVTDLQSEIDGIKARLDELEGGGA